jgi:hypothetical protein
MEAFCRSDPDINKGAVMVLAYEEISYSGSIFEPDLRPKGR